MPKQNPLLNIVKKQKEGKAVAIYSCCSSNAFVIEAAMETAKKQDSCVLIESTANQVDQNGGYSGMTPKDFFNFCHEKAKEAGLSSDLYFLRWRPLRTINSRKQTRSRSYGIRKNISTRLCSCWFH